MDCIQPLLAVALTLGGNASAKGCLTGLIQLNTGLASVHLPTRAASAADGLSSSSLQGTHPIP